MWINSLSDQFFIKIVNNSKHDVSVTAGTWAEDTAPGTITECLSSHAVYRRCMTAFSFFRPFTQLKKRTTINVRPTCSTWYCRIGRGHQKHTPLTGYTPSDQDGSRRSVSPQFLAFYNNKKTAAFLGNRHILCLAFFVSFCYPCYTNKGETIGIWVTFRAFRNDQFRRAKPFFCMQFLVD